MGDDNRIDIRVTAVKDLTELFRLERLVYIAATTVALAIILTVAFITIRAGKADNANLTLLFGSSGILGYTANRLIVMWTMSIQLVLKGSATGD
jgi:hypothetical protein